MRPIINHFTDNDLYTFTCMYYVLQKYPRAETEYCFFDRNRTCYPKGFAQLLCEQLEHLSEVVITDEEREYMTRCFPFLPYWFINVFLRGYRFNPSELTITQDEEGHLDIRVKGKWWSTIMWEMPILATISELMHELNGDNQKYNVEAEYEKSINKGRKIWTNGLTLGDMGTRRRFSFQHQERVIDALIQSYADVKKETDGHCGKFTGTSNVYFAMKKNIPCLGTFLTCDVTDCSPMNIVVKLIRGRITESREWHPCVKLSCDNGKTLGDPQKCQYLLSILGQ